MKHEDLLKFCGRDHPDPARDMSKPFVIGKWKYATNGHICIRVPSNGEPEIGKHVAADSLEWDLLLGNLSPLPAPKIYHSINVVPCHECIETKKCDRCDGAGIKTCMSCGNDQTCSACHGTGSITVKTKKNCDRCENNREIVEKTPCHVIFGLSGMRLALRSQVWDLLSPLNALFIAKQNPGKADEAVMVAFRFFEGEEQFAAGEGIAMGCNVDAVKELEVTNA